MDESYRIERTREIVRVSGVDGSKNVAEQILANLPETRPARACAAGIRNSPGDSHE